MYLKKSSILTKLRIIQQHRKKTCVWSKHQVTLEHFLNKNVKTIFQVYKESLCKSVMEREREAAKSYCYDEDHNKVFIVNRLRTQEKCYSDENSKEKQQTGHLYMM